MLRSTLTLLLLIVSLGCARPATTRGRFLYEVTCEGNVTRFDTVEKKKTAEYELAKRPGVNGMIPISEGVLEVCLAKDTRFDPVKSVFYTLTPTSLELSAGLTRSYRVLTFSVPEIALVGQAPAGDALEAPPELELLGGIVRVIPPGSPSPADLDLSTFVPERRAVPNRTLEWSGARLLLRLSEGTGPALAVADRTSKTLVRLKLPIDLDTASVHLSPGGTHVLVEQLASSQQDAPATGKLSLYDAQSGDRIDEIDEPRIAGLYFRGMAPTGVALYQVPDRFELVNLGVKFPAEQIELPAGRDYPLPSTFFADR
jgi:hypothetical protein